MCRFIVIGSGASSLALCSELQCGADDEIILITDGPNYGLLNSIDSPNEWDDKYSNPSLWADVSTKSKYGYFAYTNKNYSTRLNKYSQGFGIGGTTNINAMIFNLGHYLVYDAYWPTSWSAIHMKKKFKKVCGKINTKSILASGYLKELLSPENFNDYLSTTIESKSGVIRSNLAMFLLKDKILQNRLQLICNTKVLYIELDGNKLATGVRVKSILDDKEYSIPLLSKRNEIIISAGVFESPRILYDTIRLNTKVLFSQSVSPHHNIMTESDSPYHKLYKKLQSRSFQDHILVPLIFLGDWCGASQYAISSRNVFEKGPANGIHGWIYLNEYGQCISEIDVTDYSTKNENVGNPAKYPSLQLVIIDGRFCLDILHDLLLPRYDPYSKAMLICLYNNYFRPLLVSIIKILCTLRVVKWLSTFIFGVLICVVRPHSTGTLQFQPEQHSHHYNNGNSESSTDSNVNKTEISAVHIDLGHFNDSRDLDLIKIGLSGARKAVKNNTNLKHSLEVFPGPLFNWMIDTFIKLYSTTYFHACGSCPMQSNMKATNVVTNDIQSVGHLSEEAIVDEQLCVIGLSNVRIVDASVIPTRGIPSGPISSVCMVIGATAADFINSKYANSEM